MTNLEKIQNMNAEEMAIFLEKTGKCEYIHCDNCPYGKAIMIDDDVVEIDCCAADVNDIKVWLESEVEEWQN